MVLTLDRRTKVELSLHEPTAGGLKFESKNNLMTVIYPLVLGPKANGKVTHLKDNILTKIENRN